MELTQGEKMMAAAKQQINLYKGLHGDRTKEQKRLDELDLTDKECDAITEDAYNNLVHSLIEANGEIHQLRQLLMRAYEELVLLGYDSGFTNEEIRNLTNDISKYLVKPKNDIINLSKEIINESSRIW